MLRYLLFVALSATPILARIPFDYCEEGYPGPTSFDIPECESLPCDIRLGDEITMNIGIYVSRAVQRLPVRATIITEDGSFDFPLRSGDACQAIENGCPKEPGEYLISFPVKIEGLEPGTRSTIRVQIDDDQEEVVACGSISTVFQ